MHCLKTGRSFPCSFGLGIQNDHRRTLLGSGKTLKVTCSDETQSSKDSPQELKPTRSLKSSAAERNLPPERHKIVKKATKDIAAYCSKLPGEESHECWEAYSFFNREVREAEETCELEKSSGSPGDGCDNLDHWENFLREAESAGRVSDLVFTLRAVKRAKNREFTERSNIEPKSNSVKTAKPKMMDSKKEKFADMFYRMDSDMDGYLNVEEFRTSMKLLGDELHGPTVSTILEALDVPTRIDLEQFLTILDAEEVRSHSQFAEWLRMGFHHQHDREHNWWSSTD